MRSRIIGVLAGALALAACTTAPDADDPPAASSGPVSAAATSSPPATSSSPPAPQPRSDEPLVLAVNARRPPADLTPRQAGLLLDGGITRWRQLGLPGRRLTVTRDPADLAGLPPDTVAVVRGSEVGPGVSVLSVDGIDPLRSPDDYPLRAAGPEPGPVTTLIIVGDIMLGRRVGDRAAVVGDPSYALRPMTRRLASADLTIGNLESTLSTDGAPTQGDDSFAADPRVLAGLRAAGFDALGLANNHTGDYGDEALVQTIDRLANARLRHFGAGADLAEARRPVVLRRHGTSFGFVGFNTIGETPEAGPEQPGALSVSMPPRTGPLDRAELGRVLRDVRRLDRRVDVVVVMPHWGTQYTERPEPVQGVVARALVDAGADLVVGGHPHWVQGASIVDGALAVSSLGNFVFDMDFMPETREGLMLEATFWGSDLKGVRFVPYRIGADFAPRVIPYAAADRLFANFWRFSGPGATPR